MKLPRIKTADQDLSRVQDNLAKVIEPFLTAYGLFGKQYRLAEGPWPTPTSPVCALLQVFAGGQWVTVRGFQSSGRDAQACSARYYTASSQSLPAGVDTIINFGTKDYDSDSAVTVGAAWKFTCPKGKDGVYRVEATVSAISAAAGEVIASIYKNGSQISRGNRLHATTGSYDYPIVVDSIPLVAGDYIAIACGITAASAAATETVAASNHVAITRENGA